MLRGESPAVAVRDCRSAHRPAADTLVRRRGEVHVDAIGTKAATCCWLTTETSCATGAFAMATCRATEVAATLARSACADHVRRSQACSPVQSTKVDFAMVAVVSTARRLRDGNLRRPRASIASLLARPVDEGRLRDGSRGFNRQASSRSQLAGRLKLRLLCGGSDAPTCAAISRPPCRPIASPSEHHDDPGSEAAAIGSVEDRAFSPNLALVQLRKLPNDRQAQP
jgi:hypothetical protein